MSAGARDEVDCGRCTPILMLFKRRLNGEVMSTGDLACRVRLVLCHPVQEPGMAVVVRGDLQGDEQLSSEQGNRSKKAAASNGKACSNPDETESGIEVRVGRQEVAEDRGAATGRLRRLHNINIAHAPERPKNLKNQTSKDQIVVRDLLRQKEGPGFIEPMAPNL